MGCGLNGIPFDLSDIKDVGGANAKQNISTRLGAFGNVSANAAAFGTGSGFTSRGKGQG